MTYCCRHLDCSSRAFFCSSMASLLYIKRAIFYSKILIFSSLSLSLYYSSALSAYSMLFLSLSSVIWFWMECTSLIIFTLFSSYEVIFSVSFLMAYYFSSIILVNFSDMMVYDSKLALLEDTSDWISSILTLNETLSSYRMDLSMEISLILYSNSSNSWFLSLMRVFL